MRFLLTPMHGGMDDPAGALPIALAQAALAWRPHAVIGAPGALTGLVTQAVPGTGIGRQTHGVAA